MALGSERRFSRASIGLGGSTADQFNKFDQSASPKFHVGYKIEQADGSVYRYAHFGATANAGVLVAQDKSENSVADTDNAVIAPASAVTITDGTIGSKFIEFTLASATANQFAGAKLITTDDAGEGYTYDIKSNTATDNPASGNIRIELYQPLQVALDNTTDVSIVSNRFHNLEIATAATDLILAGVVCETIDAAGNYGWIQTKGIVGILQDGTIADGDMVTLSDGTSGAVQAAAGGGTDMADLIAEAIIGYCVDAGDSTGHGVFMVDVD